MRLQSQNASVGLVPSVARKGGRATISSLPTSISARTSARSARPIPAPVLVLLSATSLEFGGAFAKTLFASLGSTGTLTLRGAFAAMALLLISRPRVHRYARSNVRMILLFGLALAAMNLCFYLALSRVPLAVAVTIELAQPPPWAVGPPGRCRCPWVGAHRNSSRCRRCAGRWVGAPLRRLLRCIYSAERSSWTRRQEW